MHRSKAFIRFVSTFMVFFFSVFAIALPLYARALTLFSDKQLSVNNALLANGIDRIDSQLNQLAKLAQSLNLDSRYRVVSSQGFTAGYRNTMSILQVQANFTRSLSAHSLVYDCGVVYDNGFILTRNRNFSTNDIYWDAFFGRYLSVEGYGDFESWITGMSAADSYMLLPACRVVSTDYGSYEAMIWVIPVFGEGIYGYNRQGFFYAMVPTQLILPAIASADIIKGGMIRISDANGQTLFEHTAAEAEGAENQRGFQTLSGTGRESGIAVTVGVPRSHFSRQLSPMYDLIKLYVLVTLSVGSVLIILFAHRSSKPIRLLAQEARRTLGADCDAPGSEYELIGDSMKAMNRTLAEFSERMETQVRIIRDSLFDKMMRGNVYFESELTEFTRLFPDFPVRYRVALVRFLAGQSDTLEAMASRQIVSRGLVSDFMGENCYIKAIEDSLLLILLPEPAADGTAWREKLTQLHGWLEEKFRAYSHIALSAEVEGALLLSSAFSQASNILRSDQSSTQAVNGTESMPTGRKLPVVEFSHMQQIYESLLNGEEKVVLSVLGLIARTAPDDTITLAQTQESLRFLFGRVRTELVDLLGGLKLPLLEPGAGMNALRAAFADCARHICAAVNESKPREEDELTMRILHYIGEHFSSDTLYTKTVTAAFGISETTLQKTIRLATGKSYFEYVEDLRLNKAYELLSTTELPVSDVAAECGFASYNSMYKAFHRKYSISPGYIRRA